MTTKRLNDIAGEPGGRIAKTDREIQYWEMQVDAVRNALGPARVSLDEQRRAMEELGPELYGELAFFERRLEGMVRILAEKGLIDRAELERRTQALLQDEE